MTKLYIFDIDGTISDRGSSGTYAWFNEWLRRQKGRDVVIALASNQGGVGLRFWMEAESFGDPSKLPTELDVTVRVWRICGKLEYWTGGIIPIVALAYAYQSKTTELWGPIPPGTESDPFWRRSFRKPNVGMIKFIEHQVLERGYMDFDTLFIGDSAEDEAAANGAGIAWQHADLFFADIKKEMGHE